MNRFNDIPTGIAACAVGRAATATAVAGRGTTTLKGGQNFIAILPMTARGAPG